MARPGSKWGGNLLRACPCARAGLACSGLRGPLSQLGQTTKGSRAQAGRVNGLGAAAHSLGCRAGGPRPGGMPPGR
eukprot:14646138-Alexandrium_andersonii.AAC.1